jgi:hypothetical protein
LNELKSRETTRKGDLEGLLSRIALVSIFYAPTTTCVEIHDIINKPPYACLECNFQSLSAALSSPIARPQRHNLLPLRRRQTINHLLTHRHNLLNQRLLIRQRLLLLRRRRRRRRISMILHRWRPDTKLSTHMRRRGREARRILRCRIC